MARSFILALALLINTSTAQSFTIGLPESLSGSDIQTQVESNFVSLYAGLEENLSFAYLPLDRISYLIQHQKIDAAGYQVLDFVDSRFGVVAVPEPLTQFRLFVGCIEQGKCVVDERLGYAVISDALYTNLFCHRKQLNCLRLDSLELALKALNEGIVDGYLMQRTPDIQPPCYAKLGIMTQPVVDTKIDTYHFVSAAHRDIVNMLALRLKQLKSARDNVDLNPCEL